MPSLLPGVTSSYSVSQPAPTMSLPLLSSQSTSLLQQAATMPTSSPSAADICAAWAAAGYSSYTECYRENPTGEFAEAAPTTLAPMTTSSTTQTLRTAEAEAPPPVSEATSGEVEQGIVSMEETPPSAVAAPTSSATAPEPAPTAPYVPPSRPVYQSAPATVPAPVPSFVEQAEEQAGAFVEQVKASGTCWLCWVVLGASALVGAGITYRLRQ